MTDRHNKIHLILCITMSFFLSACDTEKKNIKHLVHLIKQSNVNQIEELPSLKKYPQISYDCESLNDPFDIPTNKNINIKDKLLARPETIDVPRPDQDRPREYLENYDLESLIMVGTLEKKGVIWALIVDKNGIIHRIRDGNYIGKNSGKIIKITEDKIYINELMLDPDNGWINREALMTIKNNNKQ